VASVRFGAVVLADAWSPVSGIAAVIAASAALVTVWFAGRTVFEARRARKESSSAHSEEMRQQAALLATTTAAHEREMAERARALASELVVQRLAQLDKIAELLRETVDVGYREAQYPPLKPETGPFTMTRLPGLLLRLEAAVAVAGRLGCPALDGVMKVAIDHRAAPMQPLGVASDAMSALRSLSDLTQNHPALTLPDDV
jgi:hypothetical protein